MNRRQPILVALAAILVGAAIWVHVAGEEPDFASPVLTAAELATLPATLDGDLRLMDAARRLCGQQAGSWRALPDAARAVYVTLWAEEVHRTVTWAQRAATAMGEAEDPSFDDIAAGYEQLGSPETARAVRGLAAPFAETASAFQAWVQARRPGQATPPPPTQRITVAAVAAFAQLAQIRPLRLQFARSHASALEIR